MGPNKRWMALLIAAGVLAASASLAQAQTTGPAFVPELLAQLAKDGWNVQATTALSNAAAKLDWSGTLGANPSVVALALESGKSQDQGLQPTAEAQLALQIALSTTQMQAAGLDSHDTAAAALTAVQGSLSDIQAWFAGGRQGNLGEIIRTDVSQAVSHQVQLAAVSQPAGRPLGVHEIPVASSTIGVTVPVSGGTGTTTHPGR